MFHFAAFLHLVVAEAWHREHIEYHPRAQGWSALVRRQEREIMYLMIHAGVTGRTKQ